ncbi:hypothetical protein [Pedobacter frigoris]|uniref:hypothetical protein n=1 Tax=Pedobacter frigoris TaxID=2571272 RepID=UPI00292E0C47|nr:hypothetical protein [Pedobacter frigoris]
MKKTLLMLTMFTVTVLMADAQSTTSKADTLQSQMSNFQKILGETNMAFKMPEGAVEIPIVKNAQMHYEYAVKFPDKNLEVRYSVAPLKKRMEEFREREKNKKPGENVQNPNASSAAISYAVALNIGGGKMDTTIKFGPFRPDAVKKEFGADWGGTTLAKLHKSFGTDYTNCIMVTLHKNDIADAYIFYMGDSRENLMKLFAELVSKNGVFYALTFKQ